jgi:hypothetical protein
MFNATLFPSGGLLLLPAPRIAGLLPAPASPIYTYRDDRLSRLSASKRAVLGTATDALLKTAIGVLNGDVESGALFLALLDFQDTIGDHAQIIIPRKTAAHTPSVVDIAERVADRVAHSDRYQALRERMMKGESHVS